MRRRMVIPLPAALAVGGLLVSASVATAATPVAKARYAGVGSDNAAWAELRVSREGRSVVRSRSSFELVLAGCGRPDRWRTFAVGGRSRRARIGRRGGFRLRTRRGREALRLSGRFARRNAARIRFRYRSRSCELAGRVTLRRVRRGRSTGCAERARTLVWTPQARIFKRRAGPVDEGIGVHRRYAFGCLFARGRAFELGEDEEGQPDSDLRLFQVAGRHVAFALDACAMGCGFSVNVVDLRDGRTVRSEPAGAPGPNTPYGGRATDLVLRDDSAIAWISAGEPTEVLASDGFGRRQLDSGMGIDLDSLELDGSTVGWLNNGTSRSATLSEPPQP